MARTGRPPAATRPRIRRERCQRRPRRQRRQRLRGQRLRPEWDYGRRSPNGHDTDRPSAAGQRRSAEPRQRDAWPVQAPPPDTRPPSSRARDSRARDSTGPAASGSWPAFRRTATGPATPPPSPRVLERSTGHGPRLVQLPPMAPEATQTLNGTVGYPQARRSAAQPTFTPSFGPNAAGGSTRCVQRAGPAEHSPRACAYGQMSATARTPASGPPGIPSPATRTGPPTRTAPATGTATAYRQRRCLTRWRRLPERHRDATPTAPLYGNGAADPNGTAYGDPQRAWLPGGGRRRMARRATRARLPPRTTRRGPCAALNTSRPAPRPATPRQASRPRATRPSRATGSGAAAARKLVLSGGTSRPREALESSAGATRSPGPHLYRLRGIPFGSEPGCAFSPEEATCAPAHLRLRRWPGPKSGNPTGPGHRREPAARRPPENSPGRPGPSAFDRGSARSPSRSGPRPADSARVPSS